MRASLRALVALGLGGLVLLLAACGGGKPTPIPTAPAFTPPTSKTATVLTQMKYFPASPIYSSKNGQGPVIGAIYVVPTRGHSLNDLATNPLALATDKHPAVIVKNGRVVDVIGLGNNRWVVTIVATAGKGLDFGHLSRTQIHTVLGVIPEARTDLNQYGWIKAPIALPWPLGTSMAYMNQR